MHITTKYTILKQAILYLKIYNIKTQDYFSGFLKINFVSLKLTIARGIIATICPVVLLKSFISTQTYNIKECTAKMLIFVMAKKQACFLVQWPLF